MLNIFANNTFAKRIWKVDVFQMVGPVSPGRYSYLEKERERDLHSKYSLTPASTDR